MAKTQARMRPVSPIFTTSETAPMVQKLVLVATTPKINARPNAQSNTCVVISMISLPNSTQIENNSINHHTHQQHNITKWLGDETKALVECVLRRPSEASAATSPSTLKPRGGAKHIPQVLLSRLSNFSYDICRKTAHCEKAYLLERIL